MVTEKKYPHLIHVNSSWAFFISWNESTRIGSDIYSMYKCVSTTPHLIHLTSFAFLSWLNVTKGDKKTCVQFKKQAF